MEKATIVINTSVKSGIIGILFTCLPIIATAQSLHTAIPFRSTASPYGYYEYLPDQYFKSDSSFPLIIYLHGIDEKGNGVSNLNNVLLHGPPKLIEKGKKFPFVILSPQNFNGFFNPAALRDFITYAVENYRIDKTRVYLTGISAGAVSIWNYLSLYQDQVTAVVPIAGNGYSAVPNACKIKNIPVWAFHGELDDEVRPGGTMGIVNAINKCNPAPKIAAKSVLYPQVGHDSWTRTYDLRAGYDIYGWMLKQSKRKAKSNSISLPKAKFNSINKDLIEVVKLPVALQNNSGIAAAAPNQIWGINKKANENYLYLIDTLGKVKDVKQVDKAPNLSWADLTKDKNGNLFIADIGNPTNHRKSLQVYKVTNPSTIAGERISAEKIEFSIPDQKKYPPEAASLNFDFESIIHFNDSLFIFSKNKTEPFNGIIKMYAIPSTAGNHAAVLKDSIFLGDDNPAQYQVTSAAISPNERNMVLLTHNRIWLFTDFKNSQFFKGKIVQIILPVFSEKLSLDFINDHELYLTDLIFRDVHGGKLYKIDLAQWLE